MSNNNNQSQTFFRENAHIHTIVLGKFPCTQLNRHSRENPAMPIIFMERFSYLS